MNRRFTVIVVILMISAVLFAATPNNESPSTPAQKTSSVLDKLRVSVDLGQVSIANMKFTTDCIVGDDSYGAFDKLTEAKKFILGSAYEKGKGFVGKSTADTYLSWQIYSGESLELRVYITAALNAPKVSNANKKNINWEVACSNGKIGSTVKGDFNYSNSTMVIYSHKPGQRGLSGSAALTITTEPLKGYPMNKPYNATMYAEIKTLT